MWGECGIHLWDKDRVWREFVQSVHKAKPTQSQCMSEFEKKKISQSLNMFVVWNNCPTSHSKVWWSMNFDRRRYTNSYNPNSWGTTKDYQRGQAQELESQEFSLSTIDRDIIETTLDKSTSKAIWSSMKRKYQGSTKVKHAHLQTLGWKFELLIMKHNW